MVTTRVQAVPGFREDDAELLMDRIIECIAAPTAMYKITGTIFCNEYVLTGTIFCKYVFLLFMDSNDLRLVK